MTNVSAARNKHRSSSRPPWGWVKAKILAFRNKRRAKRLEREFARILGETK